MKVSLITVVYNAEKYIRDCIQSVVAQTYPNIEYIVIDGGSTDLTLSILADYEKHIAHFVSEKDKGMYDALNKGIKAATGEVIGILNADDMLATPDVIQKIVETFQTHETEAVYGNLNYIDAIQTDKIIRKWVAKPFSLQDLVYGWMPAHPTLYIKREVFEKFGNYSLNYGTAADYELMLRFLYKFKIKATFLNKLIVNMRMGGMSNENFKQRYLALLHDYSAIKINGISFAFLTLIGKKLRKIPQFFA
jgi:glycosyltransferase involved in cell wall biosynthesis